MSAEYIYTMMEAGYDASTPLIGTEEMHRQDPEVGNACHIDYAGCANDFIRRHDPNGSRVNDILRENIADLIKEYPCVRHVVLSGRRWRQYEKFVYGPHCATFHDRFVDMVECDDMTDFQIDMYMYKKYFDIPYPGIPRCIMLAIRFSIIFLIVVSFPFVILFGCALIVRTIAAFTAYIFNPLSKTVWTSVMCVADINCNPFE